MIDWKKVIPRWGGDTVEPPEEKKNIGYLVDDRPPAKWENWLRKGTYEAVKENREEIENIDTKVGPITGLLTLVKTSIVNAINSLKTEVDEHKADNVTYDFQQFDKDATTGMYFRFEEYRTDDTLFRKTVLSNPDVNGYPQTETQTRYDTDGIAIINTKTFALVYDSDGLLASRDEVIA